MNRYILILVFCGSILFDLQAQTDQESQFLNGKNLFNLGKYELAMETFKDLTSDRESDYAEYASFFYALSAHRLNQDFVAKSMFLQILDRYPDWNGNKEVHYWLSELYFEEKNYLQALSELELSGSDEKNQALKSYYLGSIQDLDTLQYLLEKNPYDKDIAVELANRIKNQPYMLQDRSLLEFLVDEFELDPEEYKIANSESSVKKDRYNVSVLFPFMNDNLNPVKHKVNTPFLLEYYQGMRVGIDSLAAEGIDINLHAFDTKGDSLELIKILNNDELENTDLIIGPLLPKTNAVASLYSFNKGINMVNPLSSNTAVIGNNPYSFLFMPSRETISYKAAEYAVQSFANKTAAIYYSPKDSMSAKIYRERLELDSFNVVIYEAVPDTLSKQKFAQLTRTDEFDNLMIRQDSLGHIYLVSSSELVVSNMVSAIEVRLDQVPLLIRDDILKFRSVSLVQLERLGVRLLAYNTINPEKEYYKVFTKNYIREYGKIPSSYVYLGYELITFFGKRLSESGTLFQHTFNQEPNIYEGYFLTGFDYYQANSNQYIPVYRIEDSKLQLLEPGIEEDEENEESEE